MVNATGELMSPVELALTCAAPGVVGSVGCQLARPFASDGTVAVERVSTPRTSTKLTDVPATRLRKGSSMRTCTGTGIGRPANPLSVVALCAAIRAAGAGLTVKVLLTASVSPATTARRR